MTDTEEIRIVDYSPSYFEDFKAMNIAWISKLFIIEDVDRQVIEHPEEYILNKGGHILMAIYKGKTVGTCSLKNKGNGIFELTKMTVDENYRGLKIGRILCQATIDKAKALKANKLELYSNRAGAVVAIELYRKLGFKEVPLDTKEYQRADIKMEIEF
jgi:ribosomal protein S18 acetylase RimI-like enzyme